MRALIAVVVAAALTAAAPVAGAAHACAPNGPSTSQYSSGKHDTPAGKAEVRGGPDHIGATLGSSYLFADGNLQGGIVYGQVGVSGPNVGDYPVFHGPEFRVGGGSSESELCATPYK